MTSSQKYYYIGYDEDYIYQLNNGSVFRVAADGSRRWFCAYNAWDTGCRAYGITKLLCPLLDELS